MPKATRFLNFKTYLILMSLVFTWPGWASGPILLEAISVVEVKADKKDDSETILTLVTGDSFYVSKKKYGVWRKLLIQSPDGQNTIGWARYNDLRGNVKRLRKEETFLPADDSETEVDELPMEEPIIKTHKNELSRLYADRSGVGISFTNSFMSWGKRSFTTSDDIEWEIDDSSSNTFFLTVFADLKTGANFIIRPYINLRKTEFEGTSNSEFLNDRETNLKQTFQGLGILAKFYFPSRKMWWGLSAEGAQGQKLDISFDGDSVETEEADLAFYMLGAASLGYDFAITDDIYFLPEVRLGVVANQDPYIYFVETYLSFAYGL